MRKIILRCFCANGASGSRRAKPSPSKDESVTSGGAIFEIKKGEIEALGPMLSWFTLTIYTSSGEDVVFESFTETRKFGFHR